ncbi:MAG TPA: CSLREA domain-containing protein [Brevefilum sp.]
MALSKIYAHMLSLLVLFALIFASTAITTPVSAATIKVNTFSDNEVDDSSCTLREAIVAANTDAQYRGCPAGNGEDNIVVPNGTYTLASQLPAITSQINIIGASTSSTILQASACNPITRPEGCIPAEYRIFSVNPGAALEINTVTIRHGWAVDDSGGAIFNAGTLFVNDSALIGNVAWIGGAAANDSGQMVIKNSILSNNLAAAPGFAFGYGGAVSNYQGSLLVDGSLIEKNYSAYAGGGVYNFNGTAGIENSTLFENQATMGGGAWSNTGSTLNIWGTTFELNYANIEGGGVFNEGQISTANTTFSGNDAGYNGGGISSWNGSVAFESSTFSGNTAQEGGGVYIKDGVLNFSNTIIANSNNEDCLIEWSLGGSISTNMHNLVGDNTCSVGGINFLSGDPLLGPLANNGGLTKTHALLENSPAVDKGYCDSAPTTDQRGEVRPAGSGCDIGAYERSAAYAIFLPLIIR